MSLEFGLMETLPLIKALVRNNIVMFVRGESLKVKFALGFLLIKRIK